MHHSTYNYIFNFADDPSKLHFSIYQEGDTVPDTVHINMEGQYKCVLCEDSVSIAVKNVKRHITLHKRCIHIEGYQILMCKKVCGGRHTGGEPHYHCPFCTKNIKRRVDADKHVRACLKKKGQVKEVSDNTERDVERERYEGEAERVGNEGKAETVRSEGEAERVGNEGEAETVRSEGEAERVGNEGEAETVRSEGEAERVGNEGKAETVRSEGEAERVGNEGEAETVRSEGKAERVGNEGEAERVGNEGEVETVRREGQDRVQNEEAERVRDEGEAVRVRHEEEDRVRDEDAVRVCNEEEAERVRNEGEAERVSNEGEDIVRNEETEKVRNEEEAVRLRNEEEDRIRDEDAVRVCNEEETDRVRNVERRIQEESDSDNEKETPTKTHPSIVICNSLCDVNPTFCESIGKSKFICKLCPRNTILEQKELRKHRSLHTNHSIIHGNNKILMCKQNCHLSSRTTYHYHCPTCQKVIVRKDNARDHITKCNTLKKRQHPQNLELQPSLPKSSNLYSRYKEKNQKKRVKCSHVGCGKEVFYYNLKLHIRNCHSIKPPCINKDTYLPSVCIDRANGVYLVSSGTPGPDMPVHVQKKVVYGQVSYINCDRQDCSHFNELSRLGSKVHYECKHVQSTIFNTELAESVQLSEVKYLSNILKQETIDEIKKLKKGNRLSKSPFISLAIFKNDQKRLHFSVYAKDITDISRVRVTYDKEENAWYCQCCRGRSCIHKYTSKWALLVKFPELLQEKSSSSCKYGSMDSIEEINCPTDFPPDVVHRIISYQLENKKIPEPIPEEIMTKGRDSHFPSALKPKEEICFDCGNSNLEEDLITSKAIIITKSGVINNIQIYRKTCSNCDMVYFYQEFSDGVHNFDSKVTLSLDFCIHLRANLTTHTSVSRVIESMEREYNISICYRKQVLDAYLHFETLCDHKYTYNCFQCGKYPVMLIGDGNKKTVYNVTGNLSLILVQRAARLSLCFHCHYSHNLY